MGVCEVPPPGWMCTRAKGHEGPCAALPIKPFSDAEIVPDSLSDTNIALVKKPVRWSRTKAFLRGMARAFEPAPMRTLPIPKFEHVMCQTFGHSFDKIEWKNDDDEAGTVRRVDYVCRVCAKKVSAGASAE